MWWYANAFYFPTCPVSIDLNSSITGINNNKSLNLFSKAQQSKPSSTQQQMYNVSTSWLTETYKLVLNIRALFVV